MASMAEKVAMRRSPSSGGALAGTNKGDMYSELRRLLECPICTRPVSAPVFQCTSGHVICEKCKDALPMPKKCPSCRQVLGDIRVRALEAMAETVPYPCENSEHGCLVCLPAPGRQKHEQNECKYALFDCPNPTTDDCKWQGKANEVITHLNEVHDIPASSFQFGEVEEEWCLTCDELGEGDYWLYTTRIKNREFILYARESDGKFHVNVRSITHESIAKCSVRMKLKHNFEQLKSGPVMPVRSRQHEGYWFSVPADMIQFNPGGGMSIFISIRV